jgi:hypothetical protein
LVYATSDVKPEIFWSAWFETWPRIDYSAQYHVILPFLFRSKGSALPYLNDEQRAHYDALPRKVTIYRGCDRELQEGVSWSTRRKVAQYFATGGRYGTPDDPVIVKAIIDKCSPNFFFCTGNARNEAEIVCSPEQIISVTTFRAARHDHAEQP